MTELEAYGGVDFIWQSCQRCGWHMSERNGRSWCEVCEKPGKRWGKRRAHRRLRPRDVLRVRQAIKVASDLGELGLPTGVRWLVDCWRKEYRGRGKFECEGGRREWVRVLRREYGFVPRWAGYITRGW